MKSPIKLLIVASDPLVRSGLAGSLGVVSSCEVSYMTSPAMLLASIADDSPLPPADIALWDLGWQSGQFDDLDFREIEPPVVALVADDSQVMEALKAGARAIVARDLDEDQMLQTFRTVANGLIVLDPKVTSQLLPTLHRVPDDLDSAPTPRELQVLQLLAEGLTNRAIASQLDISEHTVKFHVNAILTKLRAQSRTEAVVIATRLGFISI